MLEQLQDTCWSLHPYHQLPLYFLTRRFTLTADTYLNNYQGCSSDIVFVRTQSHLSTMRCAGLFAIFALCLLGESYGAIGPVTDLAIVNTAAHPDGFTRQYASEFFD
jgi:hypothetical protein